MPKYLTAKATLPPYSSRTHLMAWKADFRELASYYQAGVEERRVRGLARFEHLRIMELLKRLLPEPPAVIADVGGGPGTYAVPLAALGYTVHLLDPIETHVARARERSTVDRHTRLASALVGEARSLPFASASTDVCLLFGPLYHLTATDDRQQALAEAWRILQPGGLLLATAVSRFQSLYTGLKAGYLSEPGYTTIVEQDLASGQHRNPTRNPAWFTTAYCHLPDEFAAEIEDAGFEVNELLAVDGPARAVGDLEWWLSDECRRATLLAFVRRVEAEPSLLGASPQLLATAKKPQPVTR